MAIKRPDPAAWALGIPDRGMTGFNPACQPLYQAQPGILRAQGLPFTQICGFEKEFPQFNP